MTTTLTIGKLEAARRQLETAIRLYFDEADPVSIHTLASAALQIIRKVNQKKGGKPLFREAEFLELFQPARRKEIIARLNEAANLFKHAERDEEATIMFKPVQSEFVMMEACQKYEAVSGQVVAIFMVFLAWFDLRHPGVFPQRDWVRPHLEQELGHLNKKAFLKKLLPVATRKYPPQSTNAK